jgi:hypothetical protein
MLKAVLQTAMTLGVNLRNGFCAALHDSKATITVVTTAKDWERHGCSVGNVFLTRDARHDGPTATA